MDKDLKNLVDKTITEVFENASEKMVAKTPMEIYRDVCPHCKKEIYEGNEYTEDGGTTWRHSDCKGLIARSETPSEKINGWLRPYVTEARNQRHEARKELDYDNDLGTFEPLAKDNPSSTMMAVNTTNLTDEYDRDVRDEKDKIPGYIGDVRNEVVRAERVDDIIEPEHHELGYYRSRWKYDQIRNVVIWPDGYLPEDLEIVNKWLHKHGITPKRHFESYPDYNHIYPDVFIENVVGLPLSSEEKYNKQEPGGTMSAVNIEEEVPIKDMKKAENEESKLVGARDWVRFANNTMNFVNASNIPLKATVTEISVMADEIHSVKTYIVKVDNG